VNFFSTPYHYAKCDVSHNPAGIKIVRKGNILFHAEMGNRNMQTTSEVSNEGWFGSVTMLNPESYRYFIAKIEGHSKVYKSDVNENNLFITDDGGDRLFSMLNKSEFKCVLWIVRTSATHNKSKTYK